jgi:hypothetical protein
MPDEADGSRCLGIATVHASDGGLELASQPVDQRSSSGVPLPLRQQPGRMFVAVVVATLCLIPVTKALDTGPLPEREAFLNAARARLLESHERFHQFSYKERRVDLHMNPFGRMGAGDKRVLQVYPSADPQRVGRIEIEREGVPATPESLARQEAEYRRKLAALTGRRAAENVDERRERERDELLVRRRARAMIDDIVNALEFTLSRREQRDGATAIVVSYKGRPDAKPLTREGRIAKAFKGEAWVHEQSREVIYSEATAIQDVSFGAFLGKLYQGGIASVTRQEISPGIWMPVQVRFQGSARALFRHTSFDYVVEWFDYQPMTTPAR